MLLGAHGSLQQPAVGDEFDSRRAVVAQLREACCIVDATQGHSLAADICFRFVTNRGCCLSDRKDLQNLLAIRPRVPQLHLHWHVMTGDAATRRAFCKAETHGGCALRRRIAQPANGRGRTAFAAAVGLAPEGGALAEDQRHLEVRGHDRVCEHGADLRGKRLQVDHVHAAAGEVGTDAEVLHGAVLALHGHDGDASALLGGAAGDVAVERAHLASVADGAHAVVRHAVGAQDDLGASMTTRQADADRERRAECCVAGNT
mmetsp:Transcript_122419/g.391414  ORF Transcript_122419/g.391414 Transcript_122419/m.391414 type:complete len:260 (-) Transcript_122419:2906-3685(-)